MAQHTVTLSDTDEEALLFAASQARGATLDDIIKGWVDKGVTIAAEDMKAKLKALGPLPDDRYARAKRALIGQPEPAP